MSDQSPNTHAIIEPNESLLVALKGRIEAALFITGKALSLADLSEIVKADPELVEEAIGELIQDYAFREGCALEVDDTDGYILQVREEYSDIVNQMMPLEISSAELRTLSAIAIKSPILQSELIDLRGSTAYDHIASLLKRKLISKKREGRSYLLNVTKNFHEYFKLMGDKKELASLVTQLGPEETSRKERSKPEEIDLSIDIDADE